MRRFGPLLGAKRRLPKPELRDAFVPFFRRIQEDAKRRRERQTAFLETSKQPSIRPAIKDPRESLQHLRMVKVDLAKHMNVEVGDRVRVLYGSEKGNTGIVGRIIRDQNQVIVTGKNLKRSFWHPEPGPGRPSIVSVECPIHITNVVPLDPVTKQPTRVKRRYMMNGECVRISKVSGSAMPAPVPVALNEREVLWKKYEERWLLQDKSRRGPLKEDVFGNKEHFQTVVRILREKRQVEAARTSASGGPPM